MKGEIYIEKDEVFDWIWDGKDDDSLAGIQDQMTAIILGYASPVEL